MKKKYLNRFIIVLFFLVNSTYAAEQAGVAVLLTLGARLRTACREGNLAEVKDLLQVPDIDVNEPDQNGKTPLYRACCHGHPGCVTALLKVPGIDVNMVDEDGRTPLLTVLYIINEENLSLGFKGNLIDIARKLLTHSIPAEEERATIVAECWMRESTVSPVRDLAGVVGRFTRFFSAELCRADDEIRGLEEERSNVLKS